MHPGTPATAGLPEPEPQELCAFMSGVAARILRTLQPRKARAPRRKPNHRRFLYNQLCRSFADIQAATRHLALTVLSQEGPGPQAKPRPQRPPSPFLGVAQALAVPENRGPGLALSPWALQSPTHELFEFLPLSPKEQSRGAEDLPLLAQVPPDSCLFGQAPHLLLAPSSEPVEIQYPCPPMPVDPLSTLEGPWPAGDPGCGVGRGC